MSVISRTPVVAAVVAGALLAGALGACSDTGPKAQASNFTDTLTLATINGSPLGSTTGLWFFGTQGVPIENTSSYDVAFDIDTQGRVLLLPVRAVVGGLGSAHTVGLQRDNSGFDALTKAPGSGYALDSTFVVAPGEVFAVQSADASACGFSIFSPYIYAKLQVLSVDAGARMITARYTVDPNCGYRSLMPSGIPKN
ncbi:MAG TPA: hypothetical protein VJU87_09125 [Gemmatimonadaceae bacterium]|nr:hypothetical protein [Gemmatimonadaceae bacterium]